MMKMKGLKIFCQQISSNDIWYRKLNTETMSQEGVKSALKIENCLV